MEANQPSLDARLLAAFLDGRLSMTQIAETFKITLFELIDWAESPHIAQAMAALKALAETRIQLRAAPIRAAAIDTLHFLLRKPASEIEARRIATTLLRATAPSRSGRAQKPPPAEPAPHPGTSQSTEQDGLTQALSAAHQNPPAGQLVSQSGRNPQSSLTAAAPEPPGVSAVKASASTPIILPTSSTPAALLLTRAGAYPNVKPGSHSGTHPGVKPSRNTRGSPRDAPARVA